MYGATILFEVPVKFFILASSFEKGEDPLWLSRFFTFSPNYGFMFSSFGSFIDWLFPFMYPPS
jgi:hypothetical protein